MATRVGINGFGRIGRLAFRAAQGKNLEIVGINDLTDAKTLAHLLKYDSIHGHFPGEVKAADERHRGGRAEASRHGGTRSRPSCPGRSSARRSCSSRPALFTDRAGAAKHLEAGAERVIITAPGDRSRRDDRARRQRRTPTTPPSTRIVSNASCTTNCLAPVAKVLHDEFGIESGWMTTIHAYTNDQVTLDFPHKDLRRARAAAISMIPTSTGAARAIGLVLPEPEGQARRLRDARAHLRRLGRRPLGPAAPSDRPPRRSTPR